MRLVRSSSLRPASTPKSHSARGASVRAHLRSRRRRGHSQSVHPVDGASGNGDVRLNLAQAFNRPAHRHVRRLDGIPAKTKVEAFASEQRALHPKVPTTLRQLMRCSRSTGETSPRAIWSAHRGDPGADLVTVREPDVAIVGDRRGPLASTWPSRSPSNHEARPPARRCGSFAPPWAASSPTGADVEGVIAQALTFGANIMRRTFIIHYGMTQCRPKCREVKNQKIVAMVTFLRAFRCTSSSDTYGRGPVDDTGGWWNRPVPRCGILEGYAGLYSLIGIAACMSLMFQRSTASRSRAWATTQSHLGRRRHGIVGGALMPTCRGR